MRNYCTIGIIVLSIFLGACHKKAMDQTAKPDATDVSESVKSIVVDAQADMMAIGDVYQVDSLTVNENILSVFVNYSGGCKPHVFDLVSNGMYSKSLPPQIAVCLKHANNGDACRKLVMRELKFDISKLKYSGNKTVVVKLGDKEVNYTSK